MGGGKGGGNNTPEAAKGVRIQTSSYGATRFLVYGTNRISCNIIYTNDFYSVAQTQGGK